MLYLDRSGTELEEIIAAVDAAIKSTRPVDQQPHDKGYVAGEFNTAFRYELPDETGKNVTRRSGGLGHVPALHALVRAADAVAAKPAVGGAGDSRLGPIALTVAASMRVGSPTQANATVP